MGYLSILMYIINKMVYKWFIYETEQFYTNVCRKCISNNTCIQKKFTFCALQTLNKMNKMETKHGRTRMLYRLTTTRLFTNTFSIHTVQSHSHTLFLETFIWIPFQPTLLKFNNIHKWYLWLTYERKSNLYKMFSLYLIFVAPSHTMTSCWTPDSQLLAWHVTWCSVHGIRLTQESGT